MQYRNDTPDPLLVATEPPQMVEPGGLVDVDGHVAGLTPVGDEPADDAPSRRPRRRPTPPAAAAAGDDQHTEEPEATR